MAVMSVSLPEPMKDWVEAQAQAGRYDDASDYVQDLIRREQERMGKLAHMQRLVTEGLESGISTRSVQEVMHAARRDAEAAGYAT